MNKNDFLKGVVIIEECLNKTMTKKQIDVYFDLLQELEFKTFIVGLKKMFLDRAYTNIPAPGEIYQQCTETTKEDLEALALIAKNRLRLAIRRCSMYDSIAFDDPIQHKIIMQLGGWATLNIMGIDELDKFFKFEYEKTYKTYKKRGEIGEIPLVLIGISDASNNIDDPVPKKIIGNVERYKRMCISYKNKEQAGKIEKLINRNYKSVGEIIDNTKRMIENKKLIDELC